METLGLSLIPLAVFWASFNSLIKAAEFVNSIRDDILSGMKNGSILSIKAKQAMLFDWILAMIGTVVTSVTFALVILWMGDYVSENDFPDVGLAISSQAVVPVLGTFLFILCGISDYKAMRHEMENSKSSLKPQKTQLPRRRSMRKM
jgi:hypothetical protein